MFSCAYNGCVLGLRRPSGGLHADSPTVGLDLSVDLSPADSRTSNERAWSKRQHIPYDLAKLLKVGRFVRLIRQLRLLRLGKQPRPTEGRVNPMTSLAQVWQGPHASTEPALPENLKLGSGEAVLLGVFCRREGKELRSRVKGVRNSDPVDTL